MDNKKFTYILYALFAVLVAAAIIIAVAVTGNRKEPPATGDDSSAVTDAQDTGADVTTSAVTTDAVTTAEITSAEVTTSALTTGEMTTGVVTTSAIITDELTTAEATTGPVTTSAVTTAEITTAEITTEVVTTAEVTTAEVTTAEVTTAEVTTSEVTTAEVTTAEVTTAEVTTAEITASEITTEEITTSEITSGGDITEEITEPEGSETAVPPEPGSDFTFVLSFAGDTQLADNYDYAAGQGPFAKAWAANDPSFFLGGVNDIFAADDYTLLNLEFVLTDRNLTRIAKSGTGYWYKGPTEYIKGITSASVEGVSLANNHVSDYGTEGEKDTLATVLAAGLDAGTYTNTIYVEKNGFTVAIICDAMWVNGHKYDILNRLAEAEPKSDFQIVFWHGGTEYQKAPEQWIKNACYEFVDAGADLVIGNHPHVLQPMEYYNGVRIFYSLGNFCYGGMTLTNKATVIYQAVLTISADGLLISAGENVIPCYYYSAGYNNFRPAPIENEKEKQQVMDFLNWKVSSPMLPK